MRRALLALMIVAGLIAPGLSFAANTPTLGSKCTLKGNYFGSGSKKMVCSLVNKKLVWVKALVTKPSPTLQPNQPSPSPKSPSSSSSPSNSSSSSPTKSSSNSSPPNPYAGLPLISTFSKNLSPIFPVDFSAALHTIPYLGADSKAPHPGLHVHWSNADGRWSNTGGKEHVTSYPVARAIEDGIVEKVTSVYTMSTSNGNGHQKYGIILTFARTPNGSSVSADYSMEPLIMEPAAHFYEAFIVAKEGEHVKRGDILAYLYVPPTSTGGTHVHFNLITNGQVMSPSLFTEDVVKAFSAKYLDKSWLSSGAFLPSAIGYGLTAAENPFSGTAVDYL